MPDEIPGGEPQAPSLSSPLADQIRTTFQDPEVQAQVDAFWREHSQPYVTRLEQQVATLNEADEFVKAMQESPGQAWYDMTNELLGEDLTAQLVQVLQSGDQGVEPAPARDDQGRFTPAEPAGTEPPSGLQLSDEDRQLLAELRADRQRDVYNNALSTFAEDKADLKDRVSLFHPFVSAAGGDLDAAYAGYQEWLRQAAAAGVTAEQVDAAADQQVAPPTLDGTSITPGTGLEPPRRQSLDEAVDDLASLMRPAAPPTVGSV